MTNPRPLALTLVAALSVTACTGLESTVTGSVLGGGLGAVIGHQSGRAIEGAVIGAVVGGVIGYTVGRARTERLASADATSRSQNYRAVQGLKVIQSDAAVSPSVARAGENVTLNTTLAIMSPSTSKVNVRQRIAIYKGDELVGNIVEDNFSLEPGTHRVSRSIDLQKDFPKGRYTYVSHIKATTSDDMSESSDEATFTVS